MSLDEEASHSLREITYVRNAWGTAFYIVYMILILVRYHLVKRAHQLKLGNGLLGLRCSSQCSQSV